mmetsp:Transcript_6729/g.19351  ORF Transcript_6729/g.19351 Transcript_6729/m.19351 type:complete len:202 (-) Transcript_6729:483-1088(-)
MLVSTLRCLDSSGSAWLKWQQQQQQQPHLQQHQNRHLCDSPEQQPQVQSVSAPPVLAPQFGPAMRRSVLGAPQLPELSLSPPPPMPRTPQRLQALAVTEAGQHSPHSESGSSASYVTPRASFSPCTPQASPSQPLALLEREAGPIAREAVPPLASEGRQGTARATQADSGPNMRGVRGKVHRALERRTAKMLQRGDQPNIV